MRDVSLEGLQAMLRPPVTVDWCWRIPESELAHGPFSSREQALEDARRESDAVKVLVGHPEYLRPADWIPSDMDELLERMDMFAYDNGFPGDDQLFEVPDEDQKEAQADLDRTLAAWASKWVRPTGQWQTSEEEEQLLYPEHHLQLDGRPIDYYRGPK